MGRVMPAMLGGVPVFFGCGGDPGVAVFVQDEPTEAVDSGSSIDWPETVAEGDACAEEEPEPVIGPWADTVPVPGTTYAQGCTRPDDLPCYPNEFPVRTVTVGDVQAMVTEVNQELWRAVKGDNPSAHRSCGCNCPVESISWYEAVDFANTLSERQGLSPAYTIDGLDVSWDTDASGWRLPTEAEWERAAKGDEDHLVAGDVDVTAAAWYRENAPDGPRPVGIKEPTAHGLHDLNGNVWEWVWDWAVPYTDSAVTDPTGPTTGTVKILRGGSYVDDYRVVRTSVRRELAPDQRVDSVGLRLVRGPLTAAP